jgi:hypothetical protein
VGEVMGRKTAFSPDLKYIATDDVVSAVSTSM